MRDILREPVQQKILLLVTIFLIASVVLVVADTLWSRFSRDHEVRLENQIARRDLGKVILRNLLSIESDFYKLALTDDRRDIDVFEGQVADSIRDIKAVLGVLQSGGDYVDVMLVNLEDVDEIRVPISFSPGEGYVVEAINLTPRILDIEDTTGQLVTAVESKISASSEGERLEAEREIVFLIKQAETLLLRSRESANRIFYVTNQEIEYLEQQRTITTNLFDLGRFIFIAIVGVFELVTFVITASQVRRIIQEREANTRELQAIRVSLEQRVADRTARLERRAAELEAAAEVARSATAIRDVEDLLDRTVRLISERFGFYHAGIFLLDGVREYAVLRAASSAGGQRMLAREHRLQVGEKGIVGYVTGTGEPRIALDVGEDAVFFDNPDLHSTRSEMALPLRVRGDIIGALDVQSEESGAFDEEDVTVLQTLADQVAVAISNAQLFQQAQESLEAERRAYGELSHEAWQELLRTRPDLGQRYDPQGILPAPDRWREEVKQAVREGRVVPGEHASAPVLAVPLKVRDQVIGVLDAYKPGGAGEWTTDEVALLETLTDQLGVALESARLYQETQRRAAHERLVSAISGQLQRAMDMETLMRITAEELNRALDGSRAYVRLGIEPPLHPPDDDGQTGEGED